MLLSDFLEEINSPYKSISRVISFQSVESYPLFFISLIHTAIEKKNKKKYLYINCQEVEIDYIICLLQTAILGKATWYWLGNISFLSSSKRDKLLKVLNSYKGPHYISYFVYEKDSKEKSSSCWYIELPDKIHKDNVHILNYLGDFKANRAYTAIKRFLFKEFVQIKSDTMLLSSYYLMLLGKQKKNICKKQLLSIILPDHSLFVLSGFFFAKKSKLFFIEWLKVKDSYSTHFWTVFWSEQLWRAYFYIQYMQSNDKQNAKKICYRLAFSFINYDWKKHLLADISRSHEMITRLDFNIKNTSQYLEEIELFYTSFFYNNFWINSSFMLSFD